MNKLSLFSAVSLFALAGCGGGGEPSAPPADLILTGGTIYTVDKQNHVAAAMAVRDGKIVYVGDAAGANALKGAATVVQDLGGKAVFPGFTDSHVHLPDGGGTLRGLDLAGPGTADELLAVVDAYARAHPELPIIAGSGWDLSLFEEANPGRELLDAIVPDRPVFLVAADGHNGWANTKALEMAGYTKDTPDPQGGRIERDADGNPSGTLREAAQDGIVKLIPQAGVDDIVKNIETALTFQLSNGITASIDASIMDDNSQAGYLVVSERPDLPQHIRVSMLASDKMVSSSVTVENVEETVQKLVKRRAQFRARSAGRLDAEAVKIFVDGVVENHTAAMLEPYIGSPLGHQHAGELNLTEEALASYATQLEQQDFQVHMHAIGDRAARAALNAVEAATLKNGARDRRHQIAHLEVVQPEDIARFAPLNVTADLQTLWHFRDSYITDLTEPFLSKEVQRWLYPAQSFVQDGARLAWGSDWPVSTSDPFDSIEVAVRRQDPNEPEGDIWLPEEALTVDQMIHALTMGGAYLMGQEDVRGSLEVGKEADFIILSDDPYKVVPTAINEIEVLQTFIDGVTVYTRSK